MFKQGFNLNLKATLFLETEKSTTQKAKRSVTTEDDKTLDESSDNNADPFENVDISEVPDDKIKSGEDKEVLKIV